MEEQPTNLPSVRADSYDIEDKLGFAPYAKTISQIILDDNVDTPLTIGIFGSWGSGKTSLMRMVENEIKVAAFQNPQRLTVPIWFNAWLYSKEEILWRALLAKVITEVGRMDVPKDSEKRQRKNEQLEALKVRLYSTLGARELGSLSFGMADLLQSSGSGAQLTLTLQQGFDLLEKVENDKNKKVDTAGLTPSDDKEDQDNGGPAVSPVENEELTKMLAFRKRVKQAATDLEQGRLESLDQFRREFDALMGEYVSDEGYLVVFVDDLDRCLPEKAVEVLEAIKLFLDVKGCIFILAIDQAVVERGIQLRYRELGEASEENGERVIDGSRYLEKIVQIPFMLPPISPRTMGQYVASLAPDLPDPECGTVFAQGLEANPRHVKRAINIFSLLWRLAQNKPELTALVEPVRLAKLVALQQRHEDLYELLRKNPARLRDWEREMRNIAEGQSLRALLDDADFEGIDEEELQHLRGLLTMHDETQVDMNFSDLEPDELHAYVYLASAVEETTIPVQQEVKQTPIPSFSPKGLDEASSGDPLAADEAGVVMEEPRPQFVSVHSGLEEARLSFATATLFRDLDKQLSQFDADPFDVTQGMKMAELLGTAGWQLFDQIITPEARTVLAGQLADATQLRVAPGRSQERIPWEIVYDGPPPSGSQPLRKMKQPLETAALDPLHFWGFKHIIERPGSGYGRSGDTLAGQGKPLLLAHVGGHTPEAASVEQSLKALSGSGFQALQSPDDFLSSLTKASDRARIYILRAQAGIELGETWIGFGLEETDSADLSNLARLLSQHFDLSELQLLAFELNIEFDNLAGETRSAKTRELVLYMQRRDRIAELVQKFKELRPRVDIDSLFSPNLVRLTRKRLESWTAQGPINGILILDVDQGLVQAEDWSAWLALFYRMGFAGVVAPTIAPDLGRSWPFIQQLLTEFSNGVPLGEAMRQARLSVWGKETDPTGLFYAYFGPAALRIGALANEAA